MNVDLRLLKVATDRTKELLAQEGKLPTSLLLIAAYCAGVEDMAALVQQQAAAQQPPPAPPVAPEGVAVVSGDQS